MNCPYKGKFKVTSPQGYRTLLGKREYHDGLDLVGLENKTIYSTVSGTVEVANYENAKNKKQGFGLYVRIKKNNSSDRYYFAHLSKVYVTKGQKVSAGDALGVEGNTGFSTGAHCHYCVRGNASKSKVRNITEISGIPNKKGIYENKVKTDKEKETKKETTKDKKSDTTIAKEVIKGLWGNGANRKLKLTAAGYNYSKIQSLVNKMLGGK